MYYELYVDSLILVNFVMNLFLLLLVNQSSFCTATRLRLVLGAMAGAICYLLPFLWNGPALLKYFLGMGAGTLLMLFIAFRIRSAKALGQLLIKLVLWSFLLGGFLLFCIGRFSFVRQHMTGLAGVLGMGAGAFLIFSYLLEKRRQQEMVCSVTLKNGESCIRVSALVDSGNGLVEPISGKAVSVIEQKLFRSLWKMPPAYYRAIPYHSIGKKHGILRGYLLPEMQIEINGIVKVCRDVYIAVSNEEITGTDNECEGVKMILHPALLEQTGR